MSRVPDGVAEYSVWGLKLPTLRQRLFRCVSIRENDDGTYAITAVQHVPEKEAIVDNGAHFDGEQSGTVNGVTPPAVQHLTAKSRRQRGVSGAGALGHAEGGEGRELHASLVTVAADDGSERLVSTARTTETTYLQAAGAGAVHADSPGGKCVGAAGRSGIGIVPDCRTGSAVAVELTPGYFQITATPHLAVYDPTVQF